MVDFKYNYNKKKFKKNICKECGLCKGKPKFCYNMVYKQYPYIFISTILPKLIKIRDSKIHCPKVKDIVVEIFCNQFICNIIHTYDKGCSKLKKCVKVFESQFSIHSTFKNVFGIHTVRNKPKIIKKITPYFFCNTNNKEWLKELEQYSQKAS